MSITDELREWWVRKFPVMDKGLHKEFAAIADHIDAAHRSALEKLAAQLDESEDGWVRLPVDADGVPIRVGDVMEFTYDPPQDQPMFEVSGFGANGTLFYTPRGEVVPRKTTNASVVRHHHAPTVEDVLREFAYGLGVPVANSYVAATAAKLRLAESE